MAYTLDPLVSKNGEAVSVLRGTEHVRAATMPAWAPSQVGVVANVKLAYLIRTVYEVIVVPWFPGADHVRMTWSPVLTDVGAAGVSGTDAHVKVRIEE